MKPDLSLIGLGLYTPAEAQRLIGIPRSTLVRWLRGHDGARRFYEPLWNSRLDIEDGTFLSFLDLVQARVAGALVGAGVSPQKVRAAIALAKEIVENDYPFASSYFRTDGKTVILQVLTEDEDERLIDLFRGGQYVMKHVIEPSLRGLEFEDDIAARWWPFGKSSGILVDPKRQFGQPIEAESGIPTSVLAQAVKTEGSIEHAAQAYMIPPAAVRRAIHFEERLAA